MSNSQVSATISTSTKEKLDRFSEELGLKKNFIVEQALLYFMESRRHLPAEAFIPTRLTLESKSFDELLAKLESCLELTDELRELMCGA